MLHRCSQVTKVVKELQTFFHYKNYIKLFQDNTIQI